MGHFLTGIKGSKPRVGPSIAQMLRAEAAPEAAQKRAKRKLRKGGVRKSAKPA